MSTQADFVDNQLRDTTSSKGVFTLPCGYIEATDKGKEVLHQEVQLREMTGEEEDLIASRKVAFDQKMNTLLANCIVKVGPIADRRKITSIVPQLLLGDRTWLFFCLRRTSLGDEFPFKEECPHCEEESTIPFDLGRLNPRNMPKPAQRLYNTTLPSGRVAEFKCMSGADEMERERRKKTMKPLSLQIFLRLVSLDGKQPTPFDVRGMALRDRDVLRAEFAKVDGGVETTIDLTCPLCGHDFQRELDPGQPSFFSPSETSAIWKRRSAT